MKKLFPFAFLLTVLCASIGAQSIDEEEINSIKEQAGSIVFENYVGPVTVFNTLDQIRGIGSYLASGKGSQIVWSNKYKMIRSFQPEIKEGLDGDILVILPDAAVDHIDNLRRILSAYLVKTFDYSRSNGDVLAKFITYYNAVYYQDWEHFKTRYKSGVLANLGAENAGLSTHYSKWPGKSRIVIPLKKGGAALISSVDTSSISTDKVVKEMQKEDGKALESRREMVEIREDELDKRQEAADVQEEKLDNKKAKVKSKEEKIDRKIEEKKKEVKEAEKDSREEKKAKKELKKLEKKKEQVQEEKEELEKEEQALEEEQKAIEKEQKQVGKMRQDIAQDENSLKDENSAKDKEVITQDNLNKQNKGKSSEPKGYNFIKVDRAADPASFGTLLMVTKSGEVLKRSELNSVRGTAFSEASGGIVVIAGKNEGDGRISALVLNKDTMEVEKEGSEDIYAGSGIWTKGSDLFMIGRSGNDWVLLKYNGELELQEESSLAVNPDTGLVFINDRILVQEKGGAIKALNISTLKEIAEDAE